MKILVIDTQGPQISPVYRELLPGLSLRGIEPDAVAGTPCHPHGAFCGWCAGIPLVGAKAEAEIVFVRVFDERAGWCADMQWLLDVIAAERPDYVSRSWGAWDGDTASGEKIGRISFQEFAGAYRELILEQGFVDFGAAGNDDKYDPDNDLDFPQRDMVDVTEIIGARDREGVPCEWSGDGPGLACVMWAHRVYSPDMTGRWVLWSGTSAATPKACGACAAMGWDRAAFREYLASMPTEFRPVGDWPIPHSKWGFGDFEHEWQRFVSLVATYLLPPAVSPAIRMGPAPIEYFDYGRVSL